MSNDTLSQILTYALIAMVVILVVISIIFLKIYFSERKKKRELKKQREREKLEEQKITKTSQNTNSVDSKYGNVLDFMEFDGVEDNMIIKREKSRYLMVIECQGVNYDLMSSVEKNAVEQGFLQFLNTLRHPVQIYVQTRAINLESTIERYNQYLRNIENSYRNKQIEYDRAKNNPKISDATKQKLLYELTKSSNLYEYGKDIIKDTERLSLNNNILNKKYYLITAYNYENENGENHYNKDEIRNLAFADLYTKSQAMIRTLSAAGVKGKILDSVELTELLYMAYNREGAESFGIERALRASYDKIYSTAPDVFTRRMKELDKEIEKEAIERAQKAINRAKSQKEIELEQKQQQKEQLINEMAKIILEQNERYMGRDLTSKAKKNLENEIKEKEGAENEKKEETTRSNNQ